MQTFKRVVYNNDNFEKTLIKCVNDVVINQTSLTSSMLREEYISDLYILDKIEKNIDIPISEKNNLVKFSRNNNHKLIRFLMELYPNSSIVPSGHFLYPPGGFMGWHTNSDFPSLRVYITYVKETNKSGFKYVNDNGNIITDLDDNTITIREFLIDTATPFWHCVYSDTMRYSFGFRVDRF